MLLPVEQRNPNLAAETKEKIYSSFQILDNQLQSDHFILNNELSLADVPIGCWLHRCFILDLDFSKFKSLKKFYIRLKDDEIYTR